MHTKLIAIALLSALSINCLACSDDKAPATGDTDKDDAGSQPNQEMSFSSSDKDLEQTFYWAKKMALSYAHDGSDPVGHWYEAALPGRNAFCMRDACSRNTRVVEAQLQYDAKVCPQHQRV